MGLFLGGCCSKKHQSERIRRYSGVNPSLAKGGSAARPAMQEVAASQCSSHTAEARGHWPVRCQLWELQSNVEETERKRMLLELRGL